KKESFLSNKKLDKNYKKVLDGKDINYYSTNWNNKFVRYGNWLHRKRDEKYFLNHKVMIRQIGAVPVATFDDQGFYTLNTIYNLVSVRDYSPKFFLGIINSKFGKWFWMLKNSDFKSLFPKIKKTQIESIPICIINFSNPTEKAQHDKIVTLVEQMLAAHKALSTVQSPAEKEKLERQIEITDKSIDSLVYELYGLNEEEIKIVEGSK
ncbi:MAG TPA: TaqI-like C-terminal specificity domain-containing protein, partial [bacterium]|nr:TaqI-like C-terminal specificity domain-containing protein [bacterium]